MKATQPDKLGHFGDYGGMYVPETLMEPLNELTKVFKSATKDPEFKNLCRAKRLRVQWALFFSKEHPILEKTIENVTKNIETKRYPNDIVNTTGPGVFTNSLLEIHNKYQETPLEWRDIDKDYNKTFLVNQNKIQFSYRIFGVDFNGNLSFKLKNTKHLYNDKPHWKIEEKKIDLF